MKKIAICFALFLFALQAKAQDPDPRLFSDWYILEYIEDGVSYFSPDNYQLDIFEEGDQDCPYFFSFPNPWSSGQDCLDSITDNQFVVLYLGILAEGEICQGGPKVCWTFFGKYYPFFEDARNSGEPISYLIEEGQDKNTLILTNMAGDQAIYSNQYLSQFDTLNRQTLVYPNPVTETLLIDTNKPINRVRVYTLQGKRVIDTKLLEINFSSLGSGTYFLEIANDLGREIHRIIKE